MSHSLSSTPTNNWSQFARLRALRKAPTAGQTTGASRSVKVAVNPPKTPVTKGSTGIACATLPNICKMPGPPAPFIPVPLPNIGKSGDSPKGYTKKVLVEGKIVAIKGATFKSVGDAASKGTGGGLISANTHGPTSFIGPGSMDVKFEGKNVQLLSDPMLNNNGGGGSPPNSATMVGVLQAPGMTALLGDETCPLCGKQHDDAGKLPETEDTQGDSDALKAAVERAVAVGQKEKDRRAQAEADEANKKRERKLAAAESKLERGGAHAPKDVVDGWRNDVDQLKVKLVPAKVTLSISTMLGVVRCKDGKVYAGVSSDPYHELYDEVPAGWHIVPGMKSMADGGGSTTPQMASFAKHVGDKAKFADVWQDTIQKNEQFRASGSGEAFYPPGQCAAQQLVGMCREHGGRPVGLTERWYKTSDANAKVEVYVRDSPSSAPRKGSFGGKEAVPPCGTCQLVLTALMCPDDVAPECAHVKPQAKSCKCNP